MTDITLPSGYRQLRWNAEQWAQVPPGFCGETIPDEFIFNPDWNRELINRYWKERA
jgi:hypothetical protein